LEGGEGGKTLVVAGRNRKRKKGNFTRKKKVTDLEQGSQGGTLTGPRGSLHKTKGKKENQIWEKIGGRKGGSPEEGEKVGKGGKKIRGGGILASDPIYSAKRPKRRGKLKKIRARSAEEGGR